MPAHEIPYSPEVFAHMTSTYTKATGLDAVRTCVVENGMLTHLPYPFETPLSPTMLDKYHPQDFAMVQALSYMGADWEDTDPINTTLAYKDNYGIWCVACGNSVVTATDGSGHVCPNPTCQNHTSDICPEWASKSYT